MSENETVTTYLKSIAKFKQLTRAEEIQISTEMIADRKKIVNSLKIKKNLSRLLNLMPDLDDDERDTVMALIQNPTADNVKLLKKWLISTDFNILEQFCKDDLKLAPILSRIQTARNKMANGNLRLVISVAKSYTNAGLPFLDLIQEGNIGLLRAIDKYEIDRGLKFSTHGFWWIKQAVIRALDNSSRIIRVPVHMIDTMNRTYKKLKLKFNRGPTPEEMAIELNHPNINQIKEIMQVMQGVVSIHSKINNKENETYESFLKDPKESNETTLIDKNYKQAILLILEKLTVKEQKVFRLKFGL